MIWVLWAIFVIICIGLYLVLEEFLKLRKELGRLQQIASRDRTNSLIWLKQELETPIEELTQQSKETHVELRKLNEISNHYGQETKDRTERIGLQVQEVIRELRLIRQQESRLSSNSSSRNGRKRRPVQ